MSTHTPGHKLTTKTGRYGTSWTCECGDWRPRPADQSPWGAGRPGGPMDAVMAYIVRQHHEHAIDAAQAQGESKGGATNG